MEAIFLYILYFISISIQPIILNICILEFLFELISKQKYKTVVNAISLMSNAFSRKQHIRSAIFTFPKGKNQMPNSIYPQWFHKFITFLNHSLHKDLCCKLKPSYRSVLYLVKSSQIPATDCRNLEGILKAPSRIQYPKHSHPRQNSLEISPSGR